MSSHIQRRINFDLISTFTVTLLLRVLSATSILPKSELESANLGQNQLKFDSKFDYKSTKSQLSSTKWVLIISLLRWRERTPNFGMLWTWYRSISGLRPEMGTKMAETLILASPEKWETNGRENGRNMARKMEKMARKWFENGISGHFSHFPGRVSPKAKIHFSAIFVPKWIYTRSTGFQSPNS